jgi:hypothetical protein
VAKFLLWLILLVLCWPAALLKAVIYLPARVLGGRSAA